jgi:uncharacterized protein
VATDLTASADALFSAIRACDSAAVADLLSAKPDLLGARDQQGLSPLMVALYHNQHAIADFLLSQLAADNLTIHEAAATDNVARIERLLAENPADVNAWSPDGFQPLGLAAFFGHLEAAQLLLARGGEVNTPARHPFGVTALHAAMASSHPEFARVLIAAGAEVNARQSGGSTPLHEAAFCGYLELAAFLVEHGADVAAVDDQGRTAAHKAREQGHTAVAEFLEQRA